MNPRIKAIETDYKGYRFRSRLEARWAVFFDALGLKWQYEIEGFEISVGERTTIRYLPDFYLPDWDLFVEVKPDLPEAFDHEGVGMVMAFDKKGATDFGKFGLAAVHLQKTDEKGRISPRLVMLCGQPGVPEIRQRGGMWSLKSGSVFLSHVDFGPGVPSFIDLKAWSEYSGGSGLDIWPLYVGGNAKKTEVMRESYLFPKGSMMRGYMGPGRDYDSPNLVRAYGRARAARFEHGEKP